MKLTEPEMNMAKTIKEGCWCGQPGITLRFGNKFWYQHSGTLGTAGGDNEQHIVIFKRGRKRCV